MRYFDVPVAYQYLKLTKRGSVLMGYFFSVES